MKKITLKLSGRPITKKNSGRIRYKYSKPKKGAPSKKIPFLSPSEAYENYSQACLWELRGQYKDAPISEEVNVKCVYYMPTRHRVDLLNLMSATLDILVDADILEDDNSKIVKSHDGSRVYYDKDNPRVEITIENFEN